MEKNLLEESLVGEEVEATNGLGVALVRVVADASLLLEKEKVNPDEMGGWSAGGDQCVVVASSFELSIGGR